MLLVKLLNEHAVAPTIAHPGEDLAYDLYTSTGGIVPAHGFLSLHTGVAVEFYLEFEPELKWGFIIKPRSSVGKKGLTILGGVIDSGYRGEVMLMLGSFADEEIEFAPGSKIANLIPIPVVAKKLQIVDMLSESSRKELGFGSSG